MQTSTINNNRTLVNMLWGSHSMVRAGFLALVGSMAIWVSAKMQIPFYPVPITMQTLVVLIIAMVYGPKLGVATILLYLAEGGFGLPVFAGTPEKGIGLVYMFGPTGGYLLGFIPAIWVVGYLANRGWDKKFLTAFIAMLVGNVIIYSFGLLWLGSSLGWDKPIIAWGLTPFLLGDALKISLGTLILPGVWKLLGKSGKE